MKNNKKGSALLIVILLMNMLLLYLTTIWRAASYTYEIMHERKKYEEHWCLTNTLMEWAIALSKENFDTFINFVKYGPKSLTIKKWPHWLKKSIGGRVEFSMLNDDTLSLQVATGSKTKKERVVSCMLKRKKTNDQDVRFIIQDWEEKQR